MASWKFDQIKEEVNENGKKFENYQQSIETKKLDIRILETEIDNIQLSKINWEKVTL